MNRRFLAVFTLVVALAGALTFFGIPVASSQGITLVAAQATGSLPADNPDSPLWQNATALDVPLSAQTVTRPILPETNVKTITARALYDDKQIAIMVAWADKTKNDQVIRPEDFRDATAVEFPLGDPLPFVCMGQVNGNVNIWQWKADWQTDMTAWQDMQTRFPNMDVNYYPFATGAEPNPKDYTDPNYVPALAAGNLFAAPHVSSVENLVAGGFGTLTSQPPSNQDVHGYGVWANDQWRVIFTRDLTSAQPDDVQLAPSKVYSMAFAAWDGANGERNGQKSVSQWVSLQLGGAAPAPAGTPQPSAPAGTPEPPVPTGPNLGIIVVSGVICFFVAAIYLLYRARGEA